MKKKFVVVLCLIIILTLVGCGQYTSRNFGGTMTEELAPGTKLVNAVWKANSLWLITRPMHPGEVAETYEFRESSLFGIMEGKVIIKERGAGE